MDLYNKDEVEKLHLNFIQKVYMYLPRSRLKIG